MLDIFVISPYTHPDIAVKECRVLEADYYIGELVRQGKVAYSTVSSMHHITNLCNLPDSWDYWKRHCEMMIASTYEVHVLCLDGWEESEGTQAEIEIAKMFNKKITYINKVKKRKC
jgi:hypothetical protein